MTNPSNLCRCPACLPSIPADPATATPAEVFAYAEHLRKLAAIGALPDPAFQPYPAEAAEAHLPTAELRHRHEQATAYLRHLLPFAWQVAKVHPRYQGLSVWKRGLAALHLQLLEPVTLAPGTQQAQARAVGDWLCRAALDLGTGARRYESEPAPWYSDGSGGLTATYQPRPHLPALPGPRAAATRPPLPPLAMSYCACFRRRCNPTKPNIKLDIS